MNWREHISSDPEIMFGKMVIKGTRIPVELILEKLADDYSFEELIQAYPRITTEDVQACYYLPQIIPNMKKHLQ